MSVIKEILGYYWRQTAWEDWRSAAATRLLVVSLSPLT
ncbi:hypothetical protein DK880_00870 [Candidatus Cardinium hertigii]|uniref:Uncharacterized protein n=1 Tax=Candidatus Cardinium hertigii TaxID=247481 RepID=A0A2Z3LA02_9BACT|nr:hypothetical protein DK880_00870 [Candidatus Cardinium hertigii]